MGRVASRVRHRLGLPEEKFSDKRCGSIIRGELGLKTRRERVDGKVVARVVIWDERKMKELQDEYGIEPEEILVEGEAPS